MWHNQLRRGSSFSGILVHTICHPWVWNIPLVEAELKWICCGKSLDISSTDFDCFHRITCLATLPLPNLHGQQPMEQGIQVGSVSHGSCSMTSLASFHCMGGQWYVHGWVSLLTIVFLIVNSLVSSLRLHMITRTLGWCLSIPPESGGEFRASLRMCIHISSRSCNVFLGNQLMSKTHCALHLMIF